LEFARLVEARNGLEALYQWIFDRGLLGLHENSDMGGPGELLDDVLTHARRARNLLALYEAALSRDMEMLRQVFDPETGAWSAGPGLIPFLSDELRIAEPDQAPSGEDEQQKAWEHRERMRTLTGMSDVHYIKYDVSLDDVKDVGALSQVAMRIVIVWVQDALASLVRPSFASLVSSAEGTLRQWWEPEQLTRSWVPTNLLGAMYLQFYWLMTSAGDLSRCKYCGRIISHASSIASSGQTRKPRNDKVFCGSQCRYNYHYHNRMKPAHEGNKQQQQRPSEGLEPVPKPLCGERAPKQHAAASPQQETTVSCRSPQLRGWLRQVLKRTLISRLDYAGQPSVRSAANIQPKIEWNVS
jgi:hypothetical protein